MQNQQSATRLLTRLIELDQQQQRAYYEMGQILSAIDNSDLWDVLGFDSMTHMIEDQLSFTPTTARRHMNTYRHFKRLKYTKAEALDLLYEFGINMMSAVLPAADTKLGVRAVQNRVDEIKGKGSIINFWLTNEEREEALTVLKSYGCEVDPETGYMTHSSDAFISLVRAAKRQPKLKVVGEN